MRIAIALVAALTASSTARADTPTRNPPALITFADRDDAHRFDELAAVTGVLYPAGAFIEQRIDGAEKVGAHKTSMLQDAGAGRALEIAPLIGAFVELGRLTETAMPATEAVYALVSLLDSRLRNEGP